MALTSYFATLGEVAPNVFASRGWDYFKPQPPCQVLVVVTKVISNDQLEHPLKILYPFFTRA